MHECAGALADMTLGAGDARVRVGLPGRELRMHRRVAHLPAERRRLHPAQRSVPAEQQDDQIDGGESVIEKSSAPDSWPAKVHHRPFGRPRRVPAQVPRLQPHPQRNQQQPEDEDRRNGDEDDEAGVRIVEEPEHTARASAINTTADTVVISAPTIASGCRSEDEAARHVTPVTSGSACRRPAHRDPARAGRRTLPASAASFGSLSSSPSRSG